MNHFKVCYSWNWILMQWRSDFHKLCYETSSISAKLNDNNTLYQRSLFNETYRYVGRGLVWEDPEDFVQQTQKWRQFSYTLLTAIIWLKYCRYGVKHCSISQSLSWFFFLNNWHGLQVNTPSGSSIVLLFGATNWPIL